LDHTVEVSALKPTAVSGLRGPSPLLRLQSDERLITLTRRGQHAAFETLFSRYHARLLSFCRHMLGSREDAEDVLQDVSIQVLKYADQFEQENVMVRWLVRTTVNHCLTEHRRRFRRRASRILLRRPDLGQVQGRDRDAPDRVGLSEELEVVRQSLVELDPSLLLIVVLRYFCDLDSKAIGEMIEMNASTVRARLREARLWLAGKLIQRGIEP
jgi:RNA polymerase sigma factor (sigma-70 family)